ncbi:MAG: ABC transporter substrate-binding protein [Halanaerobiales bacterium]|nr:ABC transporter substrate-binding protein [Halanaerobiales bacterium]
MKRSVFSLYLLMIFLLVFSTFAGAQSEDVIKLGFFAPITGPAAADGESALNSAELAVEVINDKGGINGKMVELVDYDDHLDSKQSVSIAQKLTTRDNVVAVVSGSYSGTTRPAAGIYQNAKVPMISAYAIHPDIPRAGDYIFQQSFPGPVQGKVGGYMAVDELGAQEIAILYVDNDFGSTLNDNFQKYVEEKGAEVVYVDSFGIGEREFNPVLTKIKGLNPDLIYVVAYAGEGAAIMRQIVDVGIEAKILGTEGMDSTTQFLQVAGEAADGLIITTNLNRDSEEELVVEYINRYTEKYGFAPDMVGASTYDAFMLLAHVIGEVGTNPEDIKDAMYEVENYMTNTGLLYRYTEVGEAIKPVQVQVVKNGEFTYYDQITDMELIAP